MNIDPKIFFLCMNARGNTFITYLVPFEDKQCNLIQGDVGIANLINECIVHV